MEFTQIDNLPNDQYHNGIEEKVYWSSSNIKEYHNTPRKAFYQKFFGKQKDSKGIRFGNIMHDFLASKHLKGQPFIYNVFEPPINPTTKKEYGENSKIYMEAMAMVENTITPDEMEKTMDIWDMILNSQYAWFFEQVILKTGIAEPSFFIKTPIHLYKYRPDVLLDNLIIDYKSVNENAFSETKLKYRIKDYGYDVSAAFYQFFEWKRTGIWKKFYIVWILVEPPYDILLQDMAPFAYEILSDGTVIPNSGAKKFEAYKNQHELCESSNNWPGIANKYEEKNGLRIATFEDYKEFYYNEFEVEQDDF